jgi:putative transposase
MGSVGDSCDKALMENFFSTLKTELVYRKLWRTRDEAENALFAYIDGWYNTERIQHRLGWLSPDESKRPGMLDTPISRRHLPLGPTRPPPGS